MSHSKWQSTDEAIACFHQITSFNHTSLTCADSTYFRRISPRRISKPKAVKSQRSLKRLSVHEESTQCEQKVECIRKNSFYGESEGAQFPHQYYDNGHMYSLMVLEEKFSELREQFQNDNSQN